MNDYFDKIFCINLDRRKDRWESVCEEFSSNGLSVQRVRAVDGRKLEKRGNLTGGALGCALSHASVLSRIVRSKVRRALIFEDDVRFVPNAVGFFTASLKFIPPVWDMLYLSGTYAEHTLHNGPIHRVRGMYTTSSYAISYEMAKYMLSVIDRCDSPVDVAYSKEMPNKLVYSFVPGICYQADGRSDVLDDYVNYKQFFV